jgi:hypothetical protein
VQELHDKYKDKGLVVLAPHCQSAERDVLEMFLLKRSVTYAVALKADTSDYPGNGIPRAGLVDVDGKIVWQGNPNGGGLEKMIEDELKKVDLYGMNVLAKAEKAIAKKLHPQAPKLGAAWTDLQKAKAKEGAAPEVGATIERLTAHAEGLLAHAKKLAEQGDYLGAEEQAGQIEKLYKGCEWADKAAEFKKELKAKDDYKDVAKAGQIWLQVKAKAGKAKEAVPLAKALAAKFADTYYGKQADKVVRLLESSK